MDPGSPSLRARAAERFPRTRGDGPIWLMGWATRRRFPRTRGDGPAWVSTTSRGRLGVSPARAGMDPMRREHARGWTRRRWPGLICRLFPPHARGWTDPLTVMRLRRGGGFPRTRGDGPRFRPTAPLHRFPRTRGDGPVGDQGIVRLKPFPPHARGWTVRPIPRHQSRQRLFPPHARGWTVGDDPA